MTSPNKKVITAGSNRGSARRTSESSPVSNFKKATNKVKDSMYGTQPITTTQLQQQIDRILSTLNSASGIGTFLALRDTPATYVGKSGDILQVNSGETAVEYLSIALAEGIYVNSNGSDSNTGDNILKPVATLAKAILNAGVNKVIVDVNGSEYTENPTFNKAGQIVDLSNSDIVGNVIISASNVLLKINKITGALTINNANNVVVIVEEDITGAISITNSDDVQINSNYISGSITADSNSDDLIFETDEIIGNINIAGANSQVDVGTARSTVILSGANSNSSFVFVDDDTINISGANANVNVGRQIVTGATNGMQITGIDKTNVHYDYLSVENGNAININNTANLANVEAGKVLINGDGGKGIVINAGKLNGFINEIELANDNTTGIDLGVGSASHIKVNINSINSQGNTGDIGIKTANASSINAHINYISAETAIQSDGADDINITGNNLIGTTTLVQNNSTGVVVLISNDASGAENNVGGGTITVETPPFGGGSVPGTTATIYVDGTNGNDANAGTAPYTEAVATIGQAITNANANDIIYIAKGTYTEDITIDKALTIVGEEANIVADALDAVTIEASNVELNVRSVANVNGGTCINVGGAVGTNTDVLLNVQFINATDGDNSVGLYHATTGAVTLNCEKITTNNAGGALYPDNSSIAIWCVGNNLVATTGALQLRVDVIVLNGEGDAGLYSFVLPPAPAPNPSGLSSVTGTIKDIYGNGTSIRPIYYNTDQNISAFRISGNSLSTNGVPITISQWSGAGISINMQIQYNVIESTAGSPLAIVLSETNGLILIHANLVEGEIETTGGAVPNTAYIMCTYMNGAVTATRAGDTLRVMCTTFNGATGGAGTAVVEEAT